MVVVIPVVVTEEVLEVVRAVVQMEEAHQIPAAEVLHEQDPVVQEVLKMEVLHVPDRAETEDPAMEEEQPVLPEEALLVLKVIQRLQVQEDVPAGLKKVQADK